MDEQRYVSYFLRHALYRLSLEYKSAHGKAWRNTCKHMEQRTQQMSTKKNYNIFVSMYIICAET